MKTVLTVLCLVLFSLTAGYAKLPPTVTSISIDVNPVAVGSPATITVTVSPVPTKGGILFVEEAIDADGAFTSCEAAVDFTEVAMERPATTGTLSYSADTSVAGTFGYRGHFAPAGSKLAQSKSDCVDLVVQ